jgi:hypothetical protein
MKQWLKCDVKDGMFSDERTIIVHVKGNGSVEHFVPEGVVKIDGDSGFVSVDVLRRGDSTWVELPTSYGRAIPVDENQLTPA